MVYYRNKSYRYRSDFTKISYPFFSISDPKELNGRAPILRTSLLNIIAKEGDTVIYEAHLAPGCEPTPTVTWTKNGDVIPHSPDYAQSFDGHIARLTINEVYAGDAGTIKVEVKNALGDVSSSARLTVKGTCSGHNGVIEIVPKILMVEHYQGQIWKGNFEKSFFLKVNFLIISVRVNFMQFCYVTV